MLRLRTTGFASIALLLSVGCDDAGRASDGDAGAETAGTTGSATGDDPASVTITAGEEDGASASASAGEATGASSASGGDSDTTAGEDSTTGADSDTDGDTTTAGSTTSESSSGTDTGEASTGDGSSGTEGGSMTTGDDDMTTGMTTGDGMTTGMTTGDDDMVFSCADQNIGSSTPTTIEADTTGAGNQFSPDVFCSSGDSEDLAYEFTAPQAGSYTFDTRGSDIDTVLQIFDACDADEPLACNDDVDIDEGRLTSSATIELDADQSVLVVVDGFSVTGAIVLNVTGPR